jgi:phosphoribosylanthranilate isomerase
MNVKVCGITSPEDARMVLMEGVDAVGVVVDVPVDTPRKVSVERAAMIRESVSDISCAFITVIMPESAGEAVEIIDAVRPDGVQFHGNEDPDLLREVKGLRDVSIIKAVHVGEGLDLDYVRGVAEYADMLLLDTRLGDKVGGTGVLHDLKVDLELKNMVDRRIMLSGGLNASNVADANRFLRPYAVDVSSGVEGEPGRKSPELVREFMEAVKCL